ncbi:uncharacterized protein M6B38_127975 [Iris pallida]|uniref:Myb/SANT-like domain-containing protein n=1 Tax=Iris pallida TaxID=29817 RepID=A0AAX6G5C9_IRIPA|nr:uncharacterized protein M6B38_127975 [Iris pallida]
MASSKHHWTTIEDAKLVECLIDLASDGKWKADNGTFRTGYAKQLQVWLHEKLPGCSLQASPHIESRVKHMKKQYCAIAEMLGPNASGFVWNDELKCVVCDKDVFQDWVKSHPTAKGLRNKPFPYYDDLGTIFGKDKTRGERAEASIDDVESMEEVTNEVQVHDLDDDVQENVDVNENVSHSYAPTKDACSSGRRTRKRTSTTESTTLENLVSVTKNMSKLYEETSANMAKIAKCFEIETEWKSRRLNVFEEVSKVEGFSDSDMLRAGDILSRDAARANYFFTLPDGMRKLYLQSLLNRFTY